MNMTNWLFLTTLFTYLAVAKGQIPQTTILSNTLLPADKTASISVDKDGTSFVAGLYVSGAKINVQKFELNEDEWQEVGGAITLSQATDNTRWGKGLAYSGDGTILAVSQIQHRSKRGRVNLYEWVESDWVLRQRINGNEVNAYFGNSVSLSENGEILVVGAYLSDQGSNNGGVTRIYKRENNAWSELTQPVIGDANDFSGWSTAISSSGSVIAIGSYKDRENFNNGGSVTVYDLVGSTLNPRPTIYGLKNNAMFGSSVALSADGNIVAVGAYGDGPSRAGELKVFQYTGSGWDQIGQDIDGLSSHGGAGNFGIQISLSENGDRIASVDNRKYLVRGYEYDAASDSWIMFHDEAGGSNFKYVLAELSANGETLIYGCTSQNGSSGTLGAMKLSSASTESPTVSPTSSPSAEPSAYPSAVPSMSPTQFQTDVPTYDPWSIGNANVDTDSSSGTIYISHDIRDIPDLADVTFYESDCQSPLSGDIIFLDYGPDIGPSNITYEVSVDLIEANASSAIYFDSDSTGFFYFCSELVTSTDDGERLGISRSLYNVNINFANFSFAVGTSSDPIEQIDIDIAFSVSACECDENYECVNNIYHQGNTAPLLEICIFPDNPSTEITNFNLKLQSTVSNYEYNPVQIGNDGPVSDSLTETSESGGIQKVKTRIIEGLFDEGGEITVSGVVIVGIAGKQPEVKGIELSIQVQAGEEQGGCFNNLFTRISGFFF